MLLFIKNKISKFISYFYDTKKAELVNTNLVVKKYYKQDFDKPNLFVGKIIGNPRLEGKIISFDENNINMEIIKIEDKYFQRYMEIGKIYPLFRHQHWDTEGVMLWEVEPTSMKRQVSQILLFWEEDIGWTWELDM